MTQEQITQVAQQDGDATMAFIESFRNGDSDNALQLIEDLIAAVRRDTADDIVIDLNDFGQTEAAGIVKENYL